MPIVELPFNPFINSFNGKTFFSSIENILPARGSKASSDWSVLWSHIAMNRVYRPTTDCVSWAMPLRQSLNKSRRPTRRLAACSYTRTHLSNRSTKFGMCNRNLVIDCASLPTEQLGLKPPDQESIFGRTKMSGADSDHEEEVLDLSKVSNRFDLSACWRSQHDWILANFTFENDLARFLKIGEVLEISLLACTLPPEGMSRSFAQIWDGPSDWGN